MATDGRDALELVDQRLRHPLEELLGVGRERLDVPPLPFGVQGVEGERALPRARRAGDDGQRPVGDLDGDSLQVVLPGVDDADGGRRTFGTEGGRKTDGRRMSVRGEFVSPSFRPSFRLSASPYLSRFMSRLLTPKFLLRGFEIFGPGLAGGVRDHARLRERLPRLPRGASAGSTGPGCCVGLGLASMDWLGGGLRNWVVARHVHPNPLAQGDDSGRRHGRLGRLHHAAQFGRGADDDVHHAALRRAAAGGGHVDLHELRRHDPVLRHRGAAGAAVRRRPVAGPARERAGPLALRPVPAAA